MWHSVYKYVTNEKDTTYVFIVQLMLGIHR